MNEQLRIQLSGEDGWQPRAIKCWSMRVDGWWTFHTGHINKQTMELQCEVLPFVVPKPWNHHHHDHYGGWNHDEGTLRQSRVFRPAR